MSTIRFVFRALALCLLAVGAHAQQWKPAQPVKLVVAAAPGGTTDIVARRLAQALEKEFGQSVIVENRPGQGGFVALGIVRDAKPDGETLLVSGPQVFMSRSASEAIVPIAAIGVVPFVIIARKGMTLPDLRKKQSPAVYAPGFYPPLVIAAQQLSSPAFADLPSDVAAIAAVMEGKIDLAVIPYAAAVNRIKEIAVLGVIGRQGLPELDAFPALELPAFLANPVIGVFAPRKTSPDVVASLNYSINRALATPEVRKDLIAARIGPPPASLGAFGNVISALVGVIHDKCKVKNTCEADRACPRPCPES